jgi:hypothetical protein
MPNPTYKLIASVKVGSGGAANIDFQNIPQTYNDLKIVYSLRSPRAATADAISFNINGSTANRTYKEMYGTGTSFSGGSGAAIFGGYFPSATATASVFGNGEIYFSNYTSASNKVMATSNVSENNAAEAYQNVAGSLRSNSAAISRITLIADYAGSFNEYSTAYLYGINNVYKATGGNSVYSDGTYAYHVFTSDGTFTPWTVINNVDFLVIAGGGSGGSRIGGGGGAGGYRTSAGTSGGNASAESKLNLGIQAYTVTIGAGGTAVTSVPGVAGNNGNNSVFGSITSLGGGGGGGYAATLTGLSGGSGGGASFQSVTNALGTTGQGSNGGAGATGVIAAGGGGGASAVGGNAVPSQVGGNGGAGLASTISSTSITRAGGGGGSGSTTAGSGGSGGGGAGSTIVANATAGTVNTGGGGGGARNEYDSAGVVSGAGGSGIVIVRYEI